MKTITINSVSELSKVADEFIASLGNRSVVALYGAMGAGKTTLIAEILRHLGSTDTVTSPTFAIVNQYYTSDDSPVYHFDFYRIDSPAEAFDIGFEEYFSSGDLCLVEWPEKIDGFLPSDAMCVKIDILEDGSRCFTFD